MIEIHHPSPYLGAVITGVDVTNLSSEEFGLIYDTWIERAVICVRGQDLDMARYLEYSERFGRLKLHLVKKTRHRDYPLITVMGTDKFNPDGTLNEAVLKRGVGWHTDSPWDQEVCKGTQLYAQAIPSQGGDTLFASMYHAWDCLPEHLKERLKGVEAEFVYGGRKAISNALLNPEDRGLAPAVHPVVRLHEESRRTALYINPVHITRLRGMSDDESETLLAEVFEHLVPEGSTYRHQWQRGDIVLWDNRCTMHSATGDYPVEEDRIHWRVTIMAPARDADPGSASGTAPGTTFGAD